MKNNKGFTLVEIIVAVTLLAILIGVTIGGVYQYQDKASINSDIQSAESMYSSLQTIDQDYDFYLWSRNNKGKTLEVSWSDESDDALTANFHDSGNIVMDSGSRLSDKLNDLLGKLPSSQTQGSFKITFYANGDTPYVNVIATSASNEELANLGDIIPLEGEETVEFTAQAYTSSPEVTERDAILAEPDTEEPSEKTEAFKEIEKEATEEEKSISGIYYGLNWIVKDATLYIDGGKCSTVKGTHWHDSEFGSLEETIKNVEILGNITVSKCDNKNKGFCYKLFDDICNCPHINGLEKINTVKATTMYCMFDDCKSLEDIDVSHFDTANVENMAQMFSCCRAINNLDLSNFNTSKVFTMFAMFDSCQALSNLNVSNFDTTRVKYMGCMFKDCKNLQNLNISSFNTSKVCTMQYMFADDIKLTNLDLSSFNTSKVTSMYYMFAYTGMSTIDLSNFDTINCTDFEGMFYGTSKYYGSGGLEKLILGDKFNISYAQYANNMFYTFRTSSNKDVVSIVYPNNSDFRKLLEERLEGNAYKVKEEKNIGKGQEIRDFNGDGSITENE